MVTKTKLKINLSKKINGMIFRIRKKNVKNGQNRTKNPIKEN